mmetsp:Transcript_1277/g.2358  ORF Transcript_1277/g.2358 Transcript_1277/m.2358 type:complete len:231 (-) Transcript_1277:124-816(-)
MRCFMGQHSMAAWSSNIQFHAGCIKQELSKCNGTRLWASLGVAINLRLCFHGMQMSQTHVVIFHRNLAAVILLLAMHVPSLASMRHNCIWRTAVLQHQANIRVAKQKTQLQRCTQLLSMRTAVALPSMLQIATGIPEGGQHLRTCHFIASDQDARQWQLKAGASCMRCQSRTALWRATLHWLLPRPLTMRAFLQPLGGMLLWVVLARKVKIHRPRGPSVCPAFRLAYRHK